MIIAVTIWGNRVSPVFDASTKLLVVEISGGEIVHQRSQPFEGARIDLIQERFPKMDIQVLLCGAICKVEVGRLEAAGIKVIPFLTGEVERILEKFIKGEKFTEFLMPGCPAERCCKMVVETDGEVLQEKNTAGSK